MARDATAKGLEHRVRICWSSRRHEISSEPSHRCHSWFWCVGRLSTLGAPQGSIRKSRVRYHGSESVGNALKDVLPPVHLSKRKAFYSSAGHRLYRLNRHFDCTVSCKGPEQKALARRHYYALQVPRTRMRDPAR